MNMVQFLLYALAGLAFLFVGFAGWAAVFFLCARLFPGATNYASGINAPTYRWVIAWAVYLSAMFAWPVFYIAAVVSVAAWLCVLP